MAVDEGTRVVLALGCEHLGNGLHAALTEAGYHVDGVDDFVDVVDVVGADERAVVVLDDTEPGWLRAVADVVHRRPSVRPVLVGEPDGSSEFLSVITAGVCGFVSPDAGVAAIVRTVETVHGQGISIPRRFVPSLIEHVRHGRGHQLNVAAGPVELTDREWQIMQLLLQRRSTKEMAEELFVSVGTVRSHVSALLHKLGAADRDDAIAKVEQAWSL